MLVGTHKGLDTFSSPAHAFTKGYAVQVHVESANASSQPETIAWPGGQSNVPSPKELVFGILDAAVLLDIGKAAGSHGRVAILPKATYHATLRCLDHSGRTHNVIGSALLSKNNLLRVPRA